MELARRSTTMSLFMVSLLLVTACSPNTPTPSQTAPGTFETILAPKQVGSRQELALVNPADGVSRPVTLSGTPLCVSRYAQGCWIVSTIGEPGSDSHGLAYSRLAATADSDLATTVPWVAPDLQPAALRSALVPGDAYTVWSPQGRSSAFELNAALISVVNAQGILSLSASARGNGRVAAAISPDGHRALVWDAPSEAESGKTPATRLRAVDLLTGRTVRLSRGLTGVLEAYWNPSSTGVLCYAANEEVFFVDWSQREPAVMTKPVPVSWKSPIGWDGAGRFYFLTSESGVAFVHTQEPDVEEVRMIGRDVRLEAATISPSTGTIAAISENGDLLVGPVLDESVRLKNVGQGYLADPNADALLAWLPSK